MARPTIELTEKEKKARRARYEDIFCDGAISVANTVYDLIVSLAGEDELEEAYAKLCETMTSHDCYDDWLENEDERRTFGEDYGYEGREFEGLIRFRLYETVIKLIEPDLDEVLIMKLPPSIDISRPSTGD